MRPLDFLPHALWALSVAAHLYLILEHARTKGTLMSEPFEAAPEPIAPVVALNPLPDAPIATAAPEPSPVDHVALAAQAAPVIVQAAASTPGVPQHHAMAVLGNVFAALAQQAPAILQVSRASSKTSAEVGLGLGLFAAIFQALAGASQP